MDQQPPEMYSLALSSNNKVTLGFRQVPITQDDLNRIYQFIGLLAESIVSDTALATEGDIPGGIPLIPTSNAGRVLHGHFPTEVDLATAAERVALREHIRWTSQAAETERQQSHHVRKVSEKSSNGSDESSQG